jgi:cytochrome P450
MLETITQRTKDAAASLSQRIPSATRALAEPPAGSGLKPVLGQPGAPLIGHSLSILNETLAFARRHHARYGPVNWTNAFGTEVVSVFGPDGIEEVLSNRDRAFSNREGWDYIIGPFFKGGVMLMDFEEHRHHRRIMQDAFRRERLTGYLESLNPAIARRLTRWRPGERFKLYDRTKQLTLNVGAEVFVDAPLGAETERLNKAFVDAVHGGKALIRADVPGGTWHRGLAGRRLLAAYFREQLPAKRAGDGRDLFSVLCRAESDDGARFSDEEIVAHMIFVLMAAHDTSTATLSMMAYLLAKHPGWQARLREESRALGTPSPSYDDLERLASMDLVMKETLRMYAPVGMLFRKTLKDASIQGHYVPSGTQVALGLYPSMRMTPWWSDPDRFDPERFAEGRREDLSHKFAWVPFGGHAHKCIGLHFGGMEIKAILHQLLLRFAWTLPPGYEVPIGFGTGPNPADGLPISLRALAG